MSSFLAFLTEGLVFLYVCDNTEVPTLTTTEPALGLVKGSSLDESGLN